MSRIPHPIPYQGSKRKLAERILGYAPSKVETLIEPFCGSAAVSLAALRGGRTERVCLNDSYQPLAQLWQMIAEQPVQLAEGYERLWRGQKADPRGHYDQVRSEFNQQPEPARLLFLLIRCVKSAVRFNARGEFNQSPDNRRLGTHPDRMRRALLETSALISGRCCVTGDDYSTCLQQATPKDLVYLDPPYQGTSKGRDTRYHQGLDRQRLIDDVDELRSRRVPVIISFDGRLGETSYGPELPDELGMQRIDLDAGRSTQATLNGGSLRSVESLYFSPELQITSVL